MQTERREFLMIIIFAFVAVLGAGVIGHRAMTGQSSVPAAQHESQTAAPLLDHPQSNARATAGSKEDSSSVR
jgi:hypothetical protein